MAEDWAPDGWGSDPSPRKALLREIREELELGEIKEELEGIKEELEKIKWGLLGEENEEELEWSLKEELGEEGGIKAELQELQGALNAMHRSIVFLGIMVMVIMVVVVRALW